MERMPYVAANPPIVDGTLMVESLAPIAPLAVVSRGLVENASTGEYSVGAASMAVGKLDIQFSPVRFEAIKRAARYDPHRLRNHGLDGARGVGLEMRARTRGTWLH